MRQIFFSKAVLILGALVVTVVLTTSLLAGCADNRPLKYETIHEAAAKGDLDDVKRHLRRGAALESRNSDGETPLVVAYISDHTEVVKLLLDLGADTDDLINKAIFWGDTKTLKMVIKTGVKIDYLIDEALEERDTRTLELLKAAGVAISDDDLRRVAAEATTKDNLYTIMIALERYATDHSGRYPRYLQELILQDYVTAFPINPFTGKETKNIQLGSTPFEGEVIYLPVFKNDRGVIGYHLFCYGSEKTEGYDINNDGVPDHVILHLKSGYGKDFTEVSIIELLRLTGGKEVAKCD